MSNTTIPSSLALPMPYHLTIENFHTSLIIVFVYP